MKSYSLQKIQKLWWAGQIKRCLECVKGKVIHTGNSPQGGWVAYYTCDCCGTNYEYQDSDMGQTLPSLRSNADENPNLLKIKQETPTIKYEKEIDSLMRDLLYESWMNEEEHQEIVKFTFNALGITKQKLSDDIEVGVGNGYSVNQQIEIIKNVLKSK